MKQQVRIVLFIVLIVSLGLSGCQRSASKSPVTTPAATGEIPFPLPTENVMKNLAAGTQQAALTGATTVIPAKTQPPAPAAPAAPAATATLPPLVLPTNTPLPLPTAIPPTFVAVPSATPGIPSKYVLQAGEWPYCIARRFNIEPGAMLDANGLSVNSRPAAGTELNIPAGTSGWSSGSRALIDHPAIYTVKPGDTIYSIACDFGDADPNAIIAANHLTAPYDLTLGTTIQVP
jgi:LysM repeat protein